MKNIFGPFRCDGLLYVVFCLLTITIPLHAQWIQTKGPEVSSIVSLMASPSELFAGTSRGGVFRFTSSDTNWIAVNSGLPDYTTAYSIAVSEDGTNLFVGTHNTSVFTSNNNGASWTAIDSGLAHEWVLSLAVVGSNVFAGTYNRGIFISSISFTKWTAVNSGVPENKAVYSLKVSHNAGGGTNLFAAINNRGVFLSTDNGASWSAVNTGLTNNDVRVLAIYPDGRGGSNLFVGTGNGVWLRPLSEMITGVADNENQLPSTITLKQNYPNPFNPATNIEFRIANSGFVSLKVFDLIGREIATLVNEQKSAGVYQVTFDTHSLPSGVYFYRLHVGTNTDTKKLILLR